MAMTDGIMPVMDVSPSNEGGFGGGGMWIFFLFILLLFRDGGFGGSSNTGNTDFGVVEGQLGRIQDQIQYGNNTMLQGFSSLGYNTLAQFKDLSSQMASCCCETNRNIDAVRYEGAKNTCDIITSGNMNTRDLIAAGNANTQRIIDTITQNELQTLRDSLNTANLQLSQQAQSANLIATLRPAPIPAYPTCNPYASCNGGLC